MTAVKVGLATRNAKVRAQCREMVEIVARYVVQNFFKETDRGWILAAPAGRCIWTG